MKNVIIRNLYAVGMHHHGTKDLAIGPVYYPRPDLGNPFDKCAIAIYDDKHYTNISAYLRREDARHVKKLFDNNFISGTCYLRAKGTPDKFNRFKGPLQSVSIGFKMPENKIEELKRLMNDLSLFYKVF